MSAHKTQEIDYGFGQLGSVEIKPVVVSNSVSSSIVIATNTLFVGGFIASLPDVV